MHTDRQTDIKTDRQGGRQADRGAHTSMHTHTPHAPGSLPSSEDHEDNKHCTASPMDADVLAMRNSETECWMTPRLLVPSPDVLGRNAPAKARLLLFPRWVCRHPLHSAGGGGDEFTWRSCNIDMPTMESRRSVSCSSSPTGCLSWVSDLLSMKCRLRASCMLGLPPCTIPTCPASPPVTTLIH